MTPAERQRAVAAFAASPPGGWSGDAERRIVRRAVLDTLAVAVAGSADDAAGPALAVAGGTGDAARIWTAEGPAGAEAAAFTNGVLAHALDYDDAAPSWRGHPSAVLLPALLALPGAEGAPLGRIADAYAVGFEVGARLGAALGDGHYQRGWHSTATVGVLAATAAGACLLGLDAVTTGHALGLAAAQAAGPQANFGTTAKAAHAGLAAAAAVRALTLAAAGFAASAEALFGPGGFLALYGGDGDPEAFAGLGKDEPALRRGGIEAKLYPMCYGAHRAVAAALDLAAGIRPEDVERVEVVGSRAAHAALRPGIPGDGLSAKFSAAYGVAAALLDGAVGLTSFTDAAVTRPEALHLMARTDLREEDGPRLPRFGRVVLHRRDGTRAERRVDALPGRLDDDGIEPRLRRKFEDCCRFAGWDGAPEGLADRILDDPAATAGDVLDRLPRRPATSMTMTTRSVRT